MQKFDIVCVGKRIGVIKRVLRPEITEMNICVRFIDANERRWFRPTDVVVLTAAQVEAVERRFGKDVCKSACTEERVW